MKYGISTAIAVACFASIATGALAREDYCIVPGTRQIDQRATLAYRQFEQAADPRFMNLLVGTWLSTTNSPATHQVSYLYEIYQANGLYQYVNFVCSGPNVCSRYQGVGLYAVRAQNTTTFFGAKIVSDLQRDHQCLSLNARFFNANTLVYPGGGVSRRVR